MRLSTRGFPHFFALLASLSFSTLACSGSGDQPADPNGDAGPETTADAPADTDPGDGATDGGDDGDAPAGELSIDRWGARLFGSIVAVSRVNRSLWVGTAPLPDPYDDATLRGGLLRLDLDTGAVRLFEKELPTDTYGPDAKVGPVATGGAIADGKRTLVVTRKGILSITDDTLTPHAIVVDGASVSAHALAIDRGGGRKRLWAATEVGLVRMDADTFAVEKVLGADVLDTADVGEIALDPATGALFAAIYFTDGSRLVRIVDDAVAASYSPGDDGTQGGSVAGIVWSAKQNAVFAALASWDATKGGVVQWDGSHATKVVVEGQLARAGLGFYAPFGAARLALDDDDDMLIVGGQVRPKATGGIEGGGMAWVHLGDGQVYGANAEQSLVPGNHAVSLAFDPLTKRTYGALREPCNDHKLGNVGVASIAFDGDGGLHVERPVLSTVRSLATVSGVAYASLRDDNPGLACDGYTIQNGFVKLLSTHGGEIVPLTNVRDDGGATPVPFHSERFGAHVLAFRDAKHLAYAGWRDDFFAGDPNAGLTFNPAITTNTSLFTYDVAWASDTALWFGGRATHDDGDPPELADRGPRGAALVTLGTDGSFASYKHFVRASDDAKDVTGLPTGEVTAVVPAPDGSTYLVCATERVRGATLDREEGPAFLDPSHGAPRLGGIARVSADGKVTVLVSGDAIPDPRAAALADDGTLLVADATKGLLRWNGSKLETVTPPASIPSGAIPHGVFVHGDTTAVTGSLGVAVAIGKSSKFVGDVGHGWRAAARGNGVLLVGTDQGLLRVRAPGAPDVTEAKPIDGKLPAFAPVAPPPTDPGGSCIPAHTVCSSNPTGCCPGLTCSSTGFALTCE